MHAPLFHDLSLITSKKFRSEGGEHFCRTVSTSGRCSRHLWRRTTNQPNKLTLCARGASERLMTLTWVTRLLLHPINTLPGIRCPPFSFLPVLFRLSRFRPLTPFFSSTSSSLSSSCRSKEVRRCYSGKSLDPLFQCSSPLSTYIICTS